MPRPHPASFHADDGRAGCALCAAFRLLSGKARDAAEPQADLARALRRRGDAEQADSPARRRFTRAAAAGGFALALPSAWAQQAQREGVDVGKSSRFSKLVPAEQVEAAAAQQYAQLLAEARSKNALVGAEQTQAVRLRSISQRIIPFAPQWNTRAPGWKWEVNLLASKQINAFCMPGGKIAFYTGLIEQLKLTDDEVSMVMGHEVAHALREHARERMGKSAATNIGLEVGAAILGLGNVSRSLAGMGAQLLSLKFSRDDESEADLVGMELAARAGYDPRSGVSLWTKMGQATGGGGGAGSGGASKLAEYGSTHPQGPTRIRDIEANLPRVMPLYERAPKPTQRWDAGTERVTSKPATPPREQSR
ncbi:MAG TPA: M48 family metallopeptidase [Methylibium sp.]|uniref:M48 family metallopeptidase n=1 Tax=Methylibium sp. TaxID=2067992 RepID=UPI002DB923C2|nr:M48 family metallopeptidase [Methylibium sp.]HEU4458290.1 M48 family metallopeptidase [Methylibium sp.]